VDSQHKGVRLLGRENLFRGNRKGRREALVNKRESTSLSVGGKKQNLTRNTGPLTGGVGGTKLAGGGAHLPREGKDILREGQKRGKG